MDQLDVTTYTEWTSFLYNTKEFFSAKREVTKTLSMEKLKNCCDNIAFIMTKKEESSVKKVFNTILEKYSTLNTNNISNEKENFILNFRLLGSELSKSKISHFYFDALGSHIHFLIYNTLIDLPSADHHAQSLSFIRNIIKMLDDEN
jgi:hypothetical protein